MNPAAPARRTVWQRRFARGSRPLRRFVHSTRRHLDVCWRLSAPLTPLLARLGPATALSVGPPLSNRLAQALAGLMGAAPTAAAADPPGPARRLPPPAPRREQVRRMVRTPPRSAAKSAIGGSRAVPAPGVASIEQAARLTPVRDRRPAMTPGTAVQRSTPARRHQAGGRDARVDAVAALDPSAGRRAPRKRVAAVSARGAAARLEQRALRAGSGAAWTLQRVALRSFTAPGAPSAAGAGTPKPVSESALEQPGRAQRHQPGVFSTAAPASQPVSRSWSGLPPAEVLTDERRGSGPATAAGADVPKRLPVVDHGEAAAAPVAPPTPPALPARNRRAGLRGLADLAQGPLQDTAVPERGDAGQAPAAPISAADLARVLAEEARRAGLDVDEVGP